MSIFYGYNKVAGGEDVVMVEQVLSAGTKVATIRVDTISTDIYAPDVRLSGISKIIAGDGIIVDPTDNQTSVTISTDPFYVNEDGMQIETQSTSAMTAPLDFSNSPWSYTSTAFVANSLWRTDELIAKHDSFATIFLNIDVEDPSSGSAAYASAIQICINDVWTTVAYGCASAMGCGAATTVPLKAGTRVRGFLYQLTAKTSFQTAVKPGSTGITLTEFYRA